MASLLAEAKFSVERTVRQSDSQSFQSHVGEENQHELHNFHQNDVQDHFRIFSGPVDMAILSEWGFLVRFGAH